jgi:photosystem II stability/assembly factor-like uncharacterized protein
MSKLLFLATDHGLLYLERDGDGWREAGGALDGHKFTSLAHTPGDVALWAGSTDGIWRSSDLGEHWWEANEGLTERHVRSLASHPDDPNWVYAGTEPAAIFVSQDGGRTWTEIPEVARLRDENGWYLPYSPRAGAIRGLAFLGDRGYAAAEQGGLLRSDNRGQLWAMAGGSSGKVDRAPAGDEIHADVHSVVIHPTTPDQVFAPTGGGFYYSYDGGRSWTRLYPRYCRAVWVDPVRPAHMVLGPANGPDRSGEIVETIDGGDAWQGIMDGLPPSMPDYMVEQFVQVDDHLLAVLSNGQLVSAPLDGFRWRTILDPVHGVRAVVPVTPP